MAFSHQEINKIKKKITISGVVIAICWLLFLGFFIPACILVNDDNITLFKVISIVVAILSTWITIYLISNVLLPNISRKNVIKRILGYEEKTYIGEIKGFSIIRTVDKRVEAKELEIKLEDDTSYIFYVDVLDDYSSLKVGDKVEVKARYHYLMEVHKL